jgi:hypothetical protein
MTAPGAVTAGRARGLARVKLWSTRRKPRGAGRTKPHLATLRIAELGRLFEYRYGATLPEDDSGYDDLTLLAHHFAVVQADVKSSLRKWSQVRAPWLRETAITRIANKVEAKPRRFRADTIAAKLGVTARERQELDLRTIGAIDQTAAQRLKIRIQRQRQADEDRRRRLGSIPRQEYEAKSVSRSKPWQVEGISRATWYARQKKSERARPD